MRQRGEGWEKLVYNKPKRKRRRRVLNADPKPVQEITPAQYIRPSRPINPSLSTNNVFSTGTPASEKATIKKQTTLTKSKVAALIAAAAGFVALGIAGRSLLDTQSLSSSITSSASANPTPELPPRQYTSNKPNPNQSYKPIETDTYKRPDVGEIPSTPEELSALIDNLNIRLSPEEFTKKRYMSTMHLVTKPDSNGQPIPKWNQIERGISGGKRQGLLVATLSSESNIGNHTTKHIKQLEHVGIKPITHYTDGNITYHLYLCSENKNYLARAASIVTHLEGRDDYYIAIVGITLAQCDSVEK